MLPIKIETDEQKQEWRTFFKNAGYGHFQCKWRQAEVTNIQRGVRILVNLAEKKVHSLQIAVRRRDFHASRTNYLNDDSLTIYVDEHNDPENHIDALVREAIKKADSFEGDKAITDTASKDILQNLILDELKKRVVEAGYRSQFCARAKKDDSFAVLKIELPNAEKTDTRKPEHKALDASPRHVGTYNIGEFVLYLKEGQVKALLGDFHHPGMNQKEFGIPFFSDPSFDPELLYEFAFAALDRMAHTMKECLQRQNEVDRLEFEIKHEKQQTRDDFDSLWRDTWDQ